MRPEARATGVAEEPAERLRQGAAELALPLAEPQRQQLLAYAALLAKWNAVYNLTAVRDPGEILVQHLLDALAVLPDLRRALPLEQARVADVGSGAGIPGVPLAILHPGAQILLVEPVGKKCAFLRQVCGELSLTNVEVYQGRAQSLERPMDLVICRAFASLAEFLEVSGGLGGPDTLWVAMKGRQEEIRAERAALPPGWDVSVEPMQVPFLPAQRHLVLIRRPRGNHG